jgi:hypothetical protein
MIAADLAQQLMVNMSAHGSLNMSSHGEVEAEEESSVSSGRIMDIEGTVDDSDNLDTLNLTQFDVWALGITIVIGGQYFAWNAGLSAGFGTFLVATVLIALAYVSLINCIAELSGAFPFAGECHMSRTRPIRHPPPTTRTPPPHTHTHRHASCLLPPASCLLLPASCMLHASLFTLVSPD